LPAIGLFSCWLSEDCGSAGSGWQALDLQTGELPKWPNGADCKSAGSAFAGSNPALPINEMTKVQMTNDQMAMQIVLVIGHSGIGIFLGRV
jgi:hypothetical protein